MVQQYRILIFILSFLTINSSSWASSTDQINKSEQEQIREVVHHIMASNDTFVKNMPSGYFDRHIHGQKPIVTMVTCADSRVHSHAMDVHPDGDIFLVRNIGNQVSTTEGSIEYGVRHLHTPVLFVIGHSSCGAVEAAMSRPKHLEPSIWRELESIKVVSHKADDHVQVKESVESNVNHQVSIALKKYASEVKENRLTVLGGVYDFRNDYSQGNGRLVLINVNGETNPSEIEKKYSDHYK